MNNTYDTPIMMIFFNRPNTLKKVFEWVRKAQPKQLFLVQDGPRQDRPDDVEKIMECRKIVENVDWECEVHRNYAEQNMSCDHREFTGISWCFEYVDRLLILEDDCVPSDSFYGFCAEMLERYKDDERIYSVSGFNRIGVYDQTPYDYIISRAGAGIGWATWKRCWDYVQSIKSLEFVDDEEFMRYYNAIISKHMPKQYDGILARGKKVRDLDQSMGKYSSWEYLSGISAILNNQLVITPKRNMIKYIGITEDATHCMANHNLLNHKIRKVLLQEAYELEGEVKHPPAMLADEGFEELDYDSVRVNKYAAKAELVWLRIKYGRWDTIFKAIKKRVIK